MRFNSPGDHLTSLVLRQHTAQHEPTVLGQHTSIVEFQLGILAADTDHPLWCIGGQCQTVTCLNGQRVDKAVGPSIVVGLETLELTGFLTILTGDGLTRGITRQTT